jgi:hypothetical protein
MLLVIGSLVILLICVRLRGCAYRNWGITLPGTTITSTATTNLSGLGLDHGGDAGDVTIPIQASTGEMVDIMTELDVVQPANNRNKDLNFSSNNS